MAWRSSTSPFWARASLVAGDVATPANPDDAGTCHAKALGDLCTGEPGSGELKNGCNPFGSVRHGRNPSMRPLASPMAAALHRLDPTANLAGLSTAFVCRVRLAFVLPWSELTGPIRRPCSAPGLAAPMFAARPEITHR